MNEIAKKIREMYCKKECNICMEVDDMAINFRDEQFCNASVQQGRRLQWYSHNSQMDQIEGMLVIFLSFDLDLLGNSKWKF